MWFALKIYVTMGIVDAVAKLSVASTVLCVLFILLSGKGMIILGTLEFVVIESIGKGFGTSGGVS